MYSSKTRQKHPRDALHRVSLRSVPEIIGPGRMITKAPFYEDVTLATQDTAEMDKTKNELLMVDETVRGDVVGSAVLITLSPIRIGKKQPAIKTSSGADSRRSTIALSSMVSLMMIRRWWACWC